MPFITKLGSVAARAYGWLATTVAVTANDVYFYLVSMLLPGNGTNGAQNNTFLDSSTNNFTITRNGNTTQGTFSPFSQTGWSNYFDGTGDYLSVPRNAALLPVANENFTVEAWVYLTAAPSATTAQIVGFGEYGIDSDWVFSINPSLQTTFYINAIITTFTATTTITINSWNHVAVSRSGTGANNLKIFVNGVGQSFTTNSTTVGTGNRALSIGADQNGDESAFPGFISNLRLVKGTAVYTANFTPPTAPLTAISGTSLLTCQSNRFVDNSANRFAITRSGDTSVTANSPFAPNNFTPASYSGYFDGTGDYLSTTYGGGIAASQAFTFEFWIYPNGSIPVNTGIDTTQVVGGFLLYGGSTANTFVISRNSVAAIFTSTLAVTSNAWNHVAIARNTAGNLRMWINGANAGTITDSGAFTAASIKYIASQGAANYFTGLLSNYRWVVGTAVYDPTQTTITVPTAPLTAISGTSLLTCQNATFIDNSTNAFAITVNGNAQPVTSNPFGVTTTQPVAWSAATNGGSGYFDGTGDFLSVPSNSAFAFGTGAFTIEAWFNDVNTTALYAQICGASTYGLANNYLVALNGSTKKVYVQLASNGYTSTGTYTAKSWNHLAVVRNGTTVTIFVNGLNIGSYTASDNVTSSIVTSIGGASNASADSMFNGYLSNLRILNGTALYTASFAPPTVPTTAITNTSLLLNYTNAGIYDAASQIELETIGNAQISTAQSKWGGGSMAFDGTGDYLLPAPTPGATGVLPLTLGTGDFTIEFWVYFAAGSTATRFLLDWRPAGTEGVYPMIYTTAASAIAFYVSSLNRIVGGTVSATTWTHIALCRSGSSTRLFLDGVQTGSTYTDTNNYLGPVNRPVIGASGLSLGGSALNGYIDDLRITKFARYTANFTPPTAAFPTQ